MDFFRNVAARMGWGTPSLAERTEYQMERISLNFWLMLTLYRNHWIARKIVDLPANDMTRAWCKLTSQLSPGDIQRFDRVVRKTLTPSSINQTLKWARLYGGAGALIAIKGHEKKLREPLELEDINPGTYLGLISFDRWTGINPEGQICSDFSRPVDYGLPEYYTVTPEESAGLFQVHASRILRFTGPSVPTPEFQAQTWWGISVLEPSFEVLRMADNAVWAMLQLLFRAQIIAQKNPELAQLLSGVGISQTALQAWGSRMEAQNELMSNQSMMILGEGGEMQSIQYAFSGMGEVIERYLMLVAGAAGLPMTLLFGRTMTGLGQSNDADIRYYEQKIAQDQDEQLRPQLDKLYPVICMSVLGEVPDDLDFSFPSIRVLTEEEKADMAEKGSAPVIAAYNSAIISKKTSLKELRQLSDTTGVFTNITDEQIDEAEDNPGMPGEMPEGEGEVKKYGEGGQGDPEQFSRPNPRRVEKQLAAGAEDAAVDSYPVRKRIKWHGLDISIENPAGSIRRGVDDGGNPWRVKLTHDYGYLRKTRGVDGDHLDVFIGPDNHAAYVYVVHTLKAPDFVDYDEDKCFLNFPSFQSAKKAFVSNYDKRDHFGWMDTVSVGDFIDKALETHEYPQPITEDQADPSMSVPQWMRTRIDDAEFEESEHPRVKSGEKAGQFTKAGTGSAASSSQLIPSENREEWPPHIKALKIPPAWKNIRVAKDHNSTLLATGVDSKGRTQYIYSQRFRDSQAAVKFARIKSLEIDKPEIEAQLTDLRSANSEETRNLSDCATLIMKMGIRPGSDVDTKAKTKAYGATTLIGSHVVAEDGKTFLRFTGKKGVAINLEVDDPELSAMLQRRATDAGPSGRLFGKVTDTSLLAFVHSDLDHGNYKTKDFRTLVANQEAISVMKSMNLPADEKQYRRQVLAVAKSVAAKLGNTPKVALQSYINPEIFGSWRSAYAA